MISLKEVWKEVLNLRQTVERINCQWRLPVYRQRYLIIDKGNTLDSGQDGIKHLTTVITSVPSAYDPDVTSTFIDGIGRARLVQDGAIQDGYVLVCNDARSLWACAFVQGDAVAVSGSVRISAGASSVTAYVPV